MARTPWRVVASLLFMALLTTACKGGAPTETPVPPTETPVPLGISAEACLGCHGPFEKIQEATTDYITPAEVEVNPHTTIDKTNPASPHATGKGLI